MVLMVTLILTMALCGICSANVGPMGPSLNDMNIAESSLSMSKADNAQDCAAKCADNYDCLAATYDPGGVLGNQGYCYLRDADSQPVEKKGVISFEKLYPPPYDQLIFPLTITVNGTILVKDGKKYVPTSEIPVAVYLVKGNCIYENFQSGLCPADSYYMLKVPVPDANGHFEYKYDYKEDPRIWQTLALKALLPDQDTLPPPARKKHFESLELNSSIANDWSETMYIFLLEQKTDVAHPVAAVWKYTQDEENFPMVANIPKQDELKTAIRPTVETGYAEHLMNEYYSENMPIIQGRLRKITDGTKSTPYFAYDITASNLFAPDGCFRYVSFSLTRDGNLWQYMKSDTARSPEITNSIDGGSAGNYSVEIGSTGSSGTFTDPVQSPGLLFTIKNKNPDECSITSGTAKKEIYKLLTFYFESDSSQISRNNQPLAGEYLGYQKLTSKDITYLGKSGVSNAIASQIASRSTLDRAYADLLILGDCNRDSRVDISDFEIMTKMSQGQLAPDAICDMNGDGTVNAQDVDILGKHVGKDAMKGDCYTDYRVNQADIDYLKVLLAKHQEIPANCDLNSDGKLTQEDLDLLQKLVPVTIIEPAGASGLASSSENQASPGSFIPEGGGNSLPRDKEMILPANEKGQVRPFSIIDAIISIPQTVMSVFEVSALEPAGSDSQEGTTATVIKIHQEEPELPAPDSVKVVVLDDGKVPGSDTVKVSEVVRPEIIISDSASGAATNENGGNIREARVTLPETTAGIRAEIAEGRLICPLDNAPCNGVCRDVSSDRNNCGTCGFQCGTGFECTLGTCTPFCNSGLTYCNGACVSLQTDNSNCGSCGHACITGVACTNGQCVAQMVTTQPTRLGGVGIRPL
jgi:hypothetical protein